MRECLGADVSLIHLGIRHHLPRFRHHHWQLSCLVSDPHRSKQKSQDAVQPLRGKLGVGGSLSRTGSGPSGYSILLYRRTKGLPPPSLKDYSTSDLFHLVHGIFVEPCSTSSGPLSGNHIATNVPSQSESSPCGHSGCCHLDHLRVSNHGLFHSGLPHIPLRVRQHRYSGDLWHRCFHVRANLQEFSSSSQAMGQIARTHRRKPGQEAGIEAGKESHKNTRGSSGSIHDVLSAFLYLYLHNQSLP